jgi:epoxyqueuosine reductase
MLLCELPLLNLKHWAYNNLLNLRKPFILLFSTPQELSQLIKAQALLLGFDLVGIIPASILHEEAEKLQTWLSQGYHAGMDWMERYQSLRTNPAELLHHCQSVVVVGINYFPGWEAGQGDGIKIARYALGKDYHKLIRRRLAKLMKALAERNPEITGRAFVDSAPLLEKALAVRAGLGWQGKHSLLINPKLGSWLFIGELLITAPLAYDEPVPLNSLSESLSFCGSCTRCIEACPTDAIVEPAIVDANRCIAYWTIEADVSLSPSFPAEAFKGWVFGCDICQEVCPWNVKFSCLTQESSFLPSVLLKHPTPEIRRNFEADLFDKTFAGSALRRSGAEKLVQNLARVQGLSQAEE